MVPVLERLIFQPGAGHHARGLHRHPGGTAGHARDVAEHVELAVLGLHARNQCDPLGFVGDIQGAVFRHAAVIADFLRDDAAEVVLQVA